MNVAAAIILKVNKRETESNCHLRVLPDGQIISHWRKKISLSRTHLKLRLSDQPLLNQIAILRVQPTFLSRCLNTVIPQLFLIVMLQNEETYTCDLLVSFYLFSSEWAFQPPVKSLLSDFSISLYYCTTRVLQDVAPTASKLKAYLMHWECERAADDAKRKRGETLWL